MSIDLAGFIRALTTARGSFGGVSRVAVYALATGGISRIVTCPDDQINAQYDSATEGAIPVAATVTDLNSYVDVSGSVHSAVTRTALSEPSALTVVADGSTYIAWTSLPNPTQVSVSGTTVTGSTVTDGTLHLTFSAPGSYVVTLDAGVGYVRQERVIDAT